MDLNIGNKVKLYKCEDDFEVIDIDLKYDYRVRVKKLKNKNTAWIHKKQIDRII